MMVVGVFVPAQPLDEVAEAAVGDGEGERGHDGDPDEDVDPDDGVRLGRDEGEHERGVGDDEEPAHETRPRGDAGEQAHGEHHGAAEPDPARPHEEHVQPVELVPEDGVARRDD